MSATEIGVRGHMNGFDQGAEAAVRAGDEQSLQTDFRNLAHDTLAIILAGGRGSRLAELTDWRAKPAVPFGGKFRIIDFALSNCVNSGIRRIGVGTQYKSQSLIRHMQRGWSFLTAVRANSSNCCRRSNGSRPIGTSGTADAVYQNIDILRRQSQKICAGPRRAIMSTKWITRACWPTMWPAAPS